MRRCEVCENALNSPNPRTRFCSSACRSRAHRGDGKVKPLPARPAAAVPVGLVETTRARLERAGRLDTVIGAQALALAAHMTGEANSGSSLAALSREFRAVMAEALADTEQVSDSLDELAKRRRAKASGG